MKLTFFKPLAALLPLALTLLSQTAVAVDTAKASNFNLGLHAGTTLMTATNPETLAKSAGTFSYTAGASLWQTIVSPLIVRAHAEYQNFASTITIGSTSLRYETTSWTLLASPCLSLGPIYFGPSLGAGLEQSKFKKWGAVMAGLNFQPIYIETRVQIDLARLPISREPRYLLLMGVFL